MNNKFARWTGGMTLGLFGLVAVVIIAIYIATSASSEWVQAAAILGAALLAILFIRITGIGRKGTPPSE